MTVLLFHVISLGSIEVSTFEIFGVYRHDFIVV